MIYAFNVIFTFYFLCIFASTLKTLFRGSVLHCQQKEECNLFLAAYKYLENTRYVIPISGSTTLGEPLVGIRLANSRVALFNLPLAAAKFAL